ncbi:conserved hypothetical protein [Leishmania braziliensis MHOM/BR/75/M2904]|uniref:Uncharacterized protein n=2 Tax=Leishmania braziliensis TaxID=5660 RepID=A4H5M1_LEIBR|nr:conserved hypothetical protein [Leishmania braziliensis MHOM/BR/75/M2904]CAJ2467396.1 unnamed protein product [Leishmania braziliensis]CAM41785.1 conserved hypothetical protein [Leishmania braziliensis MHOM/BR/75/M2904]SYZ63267.1 hypothetical_protein [Leishmania braziliensis MHOM/BR/75/M2904]
MSVTPLGARRPPLATIPAFNAAENAASSTPSSSTAQGAPPLTQSYLHHTPPSHSNAQLLAGMNPTTTSFLSGLSTGFTSPMSRIAGTEAILEPPPTENGTGDGARQNASAAASTATVATSDDILRGIYNEKLQASVRSIIMTLTTELPQDHIFLQLLADPTTLQYCKVRLGEVVEGFLYSTQAEQYHALATEFARGERDCAMLHQRIGELEAALALTSAPAQSSTPQRPGPSPLVVPSGTSVDHAYQAAQAASPWTSSPTMMPAQAAAAPTTSSVSPSIVVNPMENEEARRELLRVLEQATHDQELHRCTQALHAVSKVVDIAHDEAHYDDKYLFEGELLGELFKCVHSLLHYVDSALESQERLRFEVQEQQQHWLYGAAADNIKSINDGAVGGSAVSASHSAFASAGAKVNSAPGALLVSGCSTPRRPQVSLGNAGTALMSSAAGSRFSSVSSPTGVDPTRPIQQQRERLQRLAEQLREGQQHASQVLQALAHMECTRRREVAQLEREVAITREEAAAAALSAADGARQVKESSERLRAEHAASVASERTELRDQLADAHAQLAVTTQDVYTARRELRSTTSRAEAAEEREKNLVAELDALKAAMARRDAELQEQKADRVTRQAELTALRAAHQLNIDALQDSGRELLCLRVEGTMAGLAALYQEAKAAKAELLEREGYRPLFHRCRLAVASQKEAARHAQAQSQLAESAQVEQAVAQRGCMDTLGVLLRSMWADDAIESSLTSSSPSTVPPAPSAIHLTDGDDTTEAARGGSTASSNAAVPGAVNIRGSPCYRLPTTLPGLCTSLEYAYDNVRARHRARQQTIDLLRAELVSNDIELRAAQASEAQLRELLRAEQSKEEQWKAEMAQLSERNPMRGLLARQDTLLKAVSDERNELRRLWNRLTGDYIALEQRNGVLHARCAEKEHENARLSGLLRRGGTPTTSTGSQYRRAASYGAARVAAAIPAAASTATEAAPGPRTLATAAAQLDTSAGHPVSTRGPDSSSSSRSDSTEASSNKALE